MIFRPADLEAKLWDTFILPHDNKFYAFYLVARKDFWDGYGLAVSDDLVHWTDRGNILNTGAGTGSGFVYRVGERWILSYCNLSAGGFRICFAESKDLLEWEIMSDEYDLLPDARWYDGAFPGRTCSRYDSLMWVEQQPDGTWFGMFTGTVLGGPTGANGVIATCTSKDGLHWEAGPPASEPCKMGFAEFVDHCEFNGRHYALVGNLGGFGPRVDPVNNPTGKSGGMYVMSSARVTGPYKMVDGDPILIGCRNAPPNWAYIPAYSTCTFRHAGKTLLVHHWMPRKEFTDAQLAICKELIEEAPNRLAMKWWDGNEKLKGDLILDLANKPEWTTPKTYELPTGVLVSDGDGDGVTLTTESSCLSYCATENLENGIVVEATLRIHGDGAGGLFFGNPRLRQERPYEGQAVLFNTAGYVEFGLVNYHVCSPAFLPENQIPRQIPQDEDINLRLLIKGEFVEAYIDDRFVQCYGFTRPVVSHVGLFTEFSQVELKSLKVFKFDL